MTIAYVGPEKELKLEQTFFSETTSQMDNTSVVKEPPYQEKAKILGETEMDDETSTYDELAHVFLSVFPYIINNLEEKKIKLFVSELKDAQKLLREGKTEDFLDIIYSWAATAEFDSDPEFKKMILNRADEVSMG